MGLMGLCMIAMGFAALGYITPIGGALLQEAIDIAVILNALRVLSGEAPPVWRLLFVLDWVSLST